MSKIISAIVTCLLCIAITSCKKKHPIEEPMKERPVATERGIAIGEVVTKNIGAAGGVIQIPNGEIKVTVPAGAVDAETSFSIQSVTNTLSRSGLNKSFRLLPEGIVFKKDIEITMTYNESTLEGTTADYLKLAYQDNKGFWHPAKDIVLDKTNQTLTVKTKHFSDWSIYAEFSVQASKSRLFAGEEAKLEVRVLDPKAVDNETYLLSNGELVPNANVEGWKKLYGDGTLSGGAAAVQTLKAPETITQPTETLVQVDVKNNNGVKLYVGAVSVLMVPKNYIAWDMGDGIMYSTTPTFIKDSQNWITLGGQKGQTSNSITVYLNHFRTGNDEFGNGVGIRAFGRGASWERVSFCPDGFIFMPGIISVYSITGYISGDFEGTLTKTNYLGEPICNGEPTNIKGSFSIKIP